MKNTAIDSRDTISYLQTASCSDGRRVTWYGCKGDLWGIPSASQEQAQRGYIDSTDGKIRIWVESFFRPDVATSQAEIVEVVRCLEDLLPEGNRMIDAVASANENAEKFRRSAARNQEKLQHVLTGKRRFFGPVRLRPNQKDEEWTGPVWLLDPEKNWDGFGIRLESIRELWEEYPELRPVSSGTDDIGPWMILDTFSISSTNTDSADVS